MSNIELVLTDVDGTLLPVGYNEPSPKVSAATEAIKAAGVTMTAATARPYEMTEDLFARLGFNDLCIYDGGASIRDASTGELVW